jgi:hypothetical protein
MERGAMGSGGETIAPNTNPTGHPRSISQWAAAATASVVNTTLPRDRSVIGRRLNRNSRQLIRQYQEQHELRSKLYRRQAGHKREQDAREPQKNCWRRDRFAMTATAATTAAFRDRFRAKEVELADNLINLALHGKTKQIRLAATERCIDRGWGRPPHRTTATGKVAQ